MDTFEQARKGSAGAARERLGPAGRADEHVDEYWSEPDYGIWETRGPPLHFVYSKVMAWVAFDRAVKAIERYGLPGPVDEWRATRDQDPRRDLRARLRQRAQHLPLGLWRDDPGCEPAADGAGRLHRAQRSALSSARSRRSSASSWSTASSSATTRTRPTTASRRAKAPSSPAASGWPTPTVSVGRRDDADKLFERLLSIRNDLGLLAEEYDTAQRSPDRQLPAGLLACRPDQQRFNLTRATRPAEQRAKVNGSDVQAPEAPKKPQRPGKGHEKMAEPGGHHVRRRAPSSKAR